MKVAVVGEGLTEYSCLPTVAGKLGNTVIRNVHFRGSNAGFDWEQLFRKKISPLVCAVAAASPDKIVVVLDRENRDECPAELAALGLSVILEECGHCLEGSEVSVVVADREFETMVFADYGVIDTLPILEAPVSHEFPATTDSRGVVSWLKGRFKAGNSYDKPQDGKFLAQRMDLASPDVLARCRGLRKLVKELTPPPVIGNE